PKLRSERRGDGGNAAKIGEAGPEPGRGRIGGKSVRGHEPELEDEQQQEARERPEEHRCRSTAAPDGKEGDPQGRRPDQSLVLRQSAERAGKTSEQERRAPPSRREGQRAGPGEKRG